MVHTTTISIAAAALLAALPVNAGLYPKSSAVLSITGKTYDSLIAKSNYTSIVEFYAPWCGHCKNLQPAYEKAAKNLAGLAKVAAIDCDDDANKPFCGSMGVQGFPTLKIVKPGKKPGRPIVEDYNGPRTAKGIVDEVIGKIPNLVTKVDDKKLEKWLAEANDTAKAILFTDKGSTSALIKAVAIDFKDSIKVAQIRNTEKASVELFGITTFPTLILLPGGPAAEGIVYDGEMKKEGMVKFLSQAAEPNQDPKPAKLRAKKESKKASKDKESFEKASKSHVSAEGSYSAASATAETIVEEPTESPSPEVDTEKPVVLPEPAPPIPILASEFDVIRECLGQKTGTCVLALLGSKPDDTAGAIVGVLSEVAHKHSKQQRKTFPFYVLPEANPSYAALKKALGLSDQTEVIAINGRRGWWRSIPIGTEVTEASIEDWVGQIKLGEGSKNKLPAGLISEVEETAEPESEATPEVTAEAPKEEATTDPHDEL